jgi:hypothetical protein
MFHAKLTATIAVVLSLMCFSAEADMTISGSPPKTATVGDKYHYEPVVKGANTATLEFSYIALPSWSKHYRGSGAIIGTPTEPGVYRNIQIQAWDGEHFAETAPFTITVVGAGGSAPTPLEISGTPPDSVTAGQYYAFNPTVVAPAGSSLTYSIANKPAWAAFSSGKGALTGTPSAADAAVDSHIVLSVSDGAESASLAAFNITVKAAPPASTGNATLSWSRPSENTNGTPLTNLAGYIVRYGTSAAALSSQIQVSSPTTTDLEIDNLTPGKWFFEVAAINTAHMESAFSSAVSTSVN